MSKKITIFVFGLLMISAASLQAQSADDVLRYSLEYPSYDPVSLVMPGVSRANGFGTFQENPAAAALMKKSYFSIDLSSRFAKETGSYLGNKSDFSDSQTDVGDLGLIYKVPTTRGSLVIGGGYSQTTDFNRAVSGNGFNKNSTITDFYNSSLASDSLFFAAFDADAIDYAGPDSSYDNTKSVFCCFKNPPYYDGISQDFELKEGGKIGEYSAFLSTEFAKNLLVGVSIGYLAGNYSYDLKFLESDLDNTYNGNQVDSDGDGVRDTDEDHINNKQTIDADISAFSARIGFVYQPSESFNAGISYRFPSKLLIKEEYNTIITNTFDNNTQHQEQAPGKFNYSISRPGQLNLGFTYKSLSGFSFSFAEQVQYKKGKNDYDASLQEDSLQKQENQINTSVKSNLNYLINLRAGVEYQVNKKFKPRLGYAYYPSPQNNVDADRQFISGGFTAQITYGLLLDFGLQYAFWNDQNTLYKTPSTSETVSEDVSHIHMMIGLRMQL